jgi:predicted ATPase
MVSGGRIKFDDTGEDLPDFFYFAANHMPAAGENAGRFSDLSMAGRAIEFTKIFTNEYSWIEELTIEVVAGVPVIFATVRGQKEKFPLPNVSGGINRIIGIMLSIASREKSVVLVDEMENGIYYKHYEALWRALLSLARNYQTQLFVTTHSDEWLKALVRAAGIEWGDIALWRIERDAGQSVVRQFGGETFKAGVEAGGEVR